ncbi:helix-turn-helix transcriptional regulator [Lactobacillus sp. ESL0785]|uniref:helix-turn-helix domain-containing protein n=1 Tax=Lactobacillus sp. ESL0785 TaxID=2983232 RepID=UPI0023F6F0D6|nr:helix-turn-helix transcriptional regulator [Lactobacillus sp. ESL0785]WEV70244.1 helix-turn-helix transcriptional regulator [Lactobacillus sp. ESL0785]
MSENKNIKQPPQKPTWLVVDDHLAKTLLVKLRQEADLSQRQLAKQSEVAKSTITKIESEKMNPTLKILNQVVTATGRQLRIQLIKQDKNSQ